MGFLEFKNKTIEYNVIRSKRRKTVGIIIDPEQGVVVRVPENLAKDKIKELVKSKVNWIINKQKLLEDIPKAKKFVDGEELIYMGKNHILKVIMTDKVSKVNVDLREDKFLIKVPVNLSEKNYRDEAKKEVIAWYKLHAKIKIDERVAYYAPKLDVEPNHIRIKEQKTRWGSCSSLGNLNFNWKIIIAPVPIIDYLVVHELAHLRHHNHSNKFWDLVETIIPDYRERKEWLRVNGKNLIIK